MYEVWLEGRIVYISDRYFRVLEFLKNYGEYGYVNIYWNDRKII